MKKLLSILLLLVCLNSQAANLITATLTVTNAPTTNGMTFVINGSTRTWTNTVWTPTTQVLTNSTLGGISTNLFLHLAANGATGVILVPDTTNSFKLIGETLTLSLTGDYASIAYVTNATGQGQLLRLPFDTLVATNRTNYASWLVEGIDTYSTSTFSAGATALTNHANLTAAQTISGAKTFTGANIYSNANQVTVGGTNSGVTIEGATVGGTVTRLTNGIYVSPTLTNGVNHGNAFSSPGTGSQSEQFGLSASATGDNDVAIGPNSSATATNGLAAGESSIVGARNGTAVGTASVSGGEDSAAFASGAQAFAPRSLAIGPTTYVANAHTNSAAIGYAAQTTAANQIMLGTSTVDVYVNNRLTVGGYVVNPSMARTNNTSLANGNNAAVDIADRGYVKVSGPTGAFTINGIAGGSDGRTVTIQNSTGYTLTIANDSGTDPTAANRIYTGKGGDISNTNNPGIVRLIYDSAVSRWIVENP